MDKTLLHVVGILKLALAALNCQATEDNYSHYAKRDYPNQVYWGDTHLHTNYSVDANLFGNVQLSPAAAYRFARGETVTANNGKAARLSRPLDFLVVSDHSEFLGLLPKINEEDPWLMRYDLGQRWRKAARNGDFTDLMQLWGTKSTETIDGRVFADARFAARVWGEYTAIAEAFNRPGLFTTFIGYEWTGMSEFDNLHRNVIFDADAATATAMLPFSSQDSQNPADLWRHLAAYEKLTGGRVLAIPHNSNLSGGLMFRPQTASGSPFSADDAKTRARWEPLVEITQIKGDSETHPLLSPNDEYADFGTWDTNLAMRNDGPAREAQQVRFDYVRSALKLGLDLGDKLGENPYKFGVIGGTDSHTALSTADSDNFWGKFGKDNPGKGRSSATVLPEAFGAAELLLKNWQQLASGYTAVWSRANTRKDLFDAMLRREVYATTGPRMTVRFFGGWNFVAADAVQPDVARVGYTKGVPMGADLPVRGKTDRVPNFLISASRDPDGANLDRVQVIKGWRDTAGGLHEQVYNVAVSAKLGDTVDLESASYRNSVGESQLSAVWIDTDFNPTEHAFYYVRVLEIPTPRWPIYDARVFGDPLPPPNWQKIQQRAYTSSIWYRPDQTVD